MKLLLDTCTFLWIALDSPQLSRKARRLFQSADNEVFLSAATAWEISVKYSLGRLPLPAAPSEFIPEWREKHGIAKLDIDEASALHEPRLPTLHNDPFDRMLICQAIQHGCALLTPDEAIKQYPVLVEVVIYFPPTTAGFGGGNPAALR